MALPRPSHMPLVMRNRYDIQSLIGNFEGCAWQYVSNPIRMGAILQLRMANFALVIAGVVHMGLSFSLCKAAGTRGLIIADSFGMVLRICYSLWFARQYFRNVPGYAGVPWRPHPWTFAVLAAACGIGLASE
eukprot:scaffold310741_cov43-Prasinocladus_malaysianus.AAC.1